MQEYRRETWGAAGLIKDPQGIADCLQRLRIEGDDGRLVKAAGDAAAWLLQQQPAPSERGY